MNFLGIGPGEVFLILIILLVVVGPERLPEFARQAGKLVIRLRNWIANSPDAQLVLRAREDLEAELAEIRRSLTEEVETVRKELETVRGDLAEAARSLEESAEAVAKTNLDVDLSAASHQTIAPPKAPAAPAAEPPAETPAAPAAATPAAETPAAPADNGQPVPRSFKPGQAPSPATPAPATAARAEDTAVEALSQRVQALGDEFSRQLAALTAELEALRAKGGEPAAPGPETAAPVELVPIAPPAPPEAAALAEVAALALPDAEPAEPRRRCKGVTRGGEPCGAAPLKGQEYCRAHARQRVLEEVA